MNFTEKNESGIPLWYPVWKGEKTVTRRSAPCLHCGKKWSEHYASEDPKDKEMLCPKIGTKRDGAGFYMVATYEPDLSRWLPSTICFKCRKEGINHFINGDGNVYCNRSLKDIYQPEETIAICPGRGKAALCATCGGWKEWHGHTAPDKELFINRYRTDFGAQINICSSYTPLRKRVVSCELESEWLKDMHRKSISTNPKQELVNITWRLSDEAKREGFASWEGLQAALKRTNPKGEPLYRIELEAVK